MCRSYDAAVEQYRETHNKRRVQLVQSMSRLSKWQEQQAEGAIDDDQESEEAVQQEVSDQ